MKPAPTSQFEARVLQQRDGCLIVPRQREELQSRVNGIDAHGPQRVQVKLSLVFGPIYGHADAEGEASALTVEANSDWNAREKGKQRYEGRALQNKARVVCPLAKLPDQMEVLGQAV